MSDGIINGIMATVSGEELETLLRQRVAHHLERAAIYRQQAATLPKVSRRADSSNILNADTMSNTAEQHERQAVYLGFVADHLDREARYRLSEYDVRGLGIGADE